MSIDTRTTRTGARSPADKSARLLGVGLVWAASALIAIGSPDMVSGSEHEHLPLAAITVWVWTAVASGYVAMTPVERGRDWLVTIAVVWGAMAVAAIMAPVMETGSDPTRIPIAALVAPPLACVVTGFLALAQATQRRS